MRKLVLALVSALVLSACGPAASPAPPKPAATQPPVATATLVEIVVDTPTRPPSPTPITATATKATATKRPATATTRPTGTAIPATATRVRITFTPAPLPTAAPVIPDTPTAAPVILDTPTAAPVVEQPTQVPQQSGYVGDGGAACIKGNISDNGHLYHFPGCPSYNATKIDEGAGERWFTSSSDAEAAGWTKASNCP